MTVIKEEYISKEITRHDLLPLSFLKKSAYTGSKGGLRYRMEKAEAAKDETAKAAGGAAAASEKTDEKNAETVLLCCVWPEPFAYAKTDAALIKRREFEFSDEGISAALLWLNEERLSYDG